MRPLPGSGGTPSCFWPQGWTGSVVAEALERDSHTIQGERAEVSFSRDRGGPAGGGAWHETGPEAEHQDTCPVAGASCAPLRCLALGEPRPDLDKSAHRIPGKPTALRGKAIPGSRDTQPGVGATVASRCHGFGTRRDLRIEQRTRIPNRRPRPHRRAKRRRPQNRGPYPKPNQRRPRELRRRPPLSRSRVRRGNPASAQPRQGRVGGTSSLPSQRVSLQRP